MLIIKKMIIFYDLGSIFPQILKKHEKKLFNFTLFPLFLSFF